MKLKKYLKDHLFVIFLGSAVFLIQMLLLAAFQVPADLTVVIGSLFLVFWGAVWIWDFLRKKRFYEELTTNLERLDRKYLILEMLRKPSFYEGELLYESLYEIDKSMNENVREYAKSIHDFKEYIEMWVHEVKIPIASLLLMCHNHPHEVDQKYVEQITRLDHYADQVLYYVRAENAENDYLIKEIPLAKVIRTVAVKNKDDLLSNQIDFVVENVQTTVFSDEKWLEFILNQIINNAVKYRRSGVEAEIVIGTEETQEQVVLYVKDNGIGIPAADLPRVFRKSFTGENGRKGAKSTGMGLYIADSLCRRLGHRLEIRSEEGAYTEVSIIFAKNEYYDPVRLQSCKVV